MKKAEAAIAAAVAVAVAAGVLGQLLPAGSSWRRLRNRCLPDLAGVGQAGHIALTFDDGPDPVSTVPFLDALDALGWRATFFMLGEMAAAHPDVAKEVARRGHEIAVHGYAHSSHIHHGPLWATRDVIAARDTIADVTGQGTALGPASLRGLVGLDAHCRPASSSGPGAMDDLGSGLAPRGDARLNSRRHLFDARARGDRAPPRFGLHVRAR